MQNAFDDIYLTIRDVDGTEWSDQLRFKMHDLDEMQMTDGQLARAGGVQVASSSSIIHPYLGVLT
jgi:hypothetical protein